MLTSSGRGDPEDLANLKPATDEDAAVGSHRQVGAVVVSRGQAGDETKLRVGREREHLARRASSRTRSSDRGRRADEPPQRLGPPADRAPRQDRREQIGASRQAGAARGHPRGRPRGPGSPPPSSQLERRRRRRLGSQMHLGARVVEEDQPPAAIEGDRCCPRGDGSVRRRPALQPLIRRRADRCDCRSPRRGRDPRSAGPRRGCRTRSCAARRRRGSRRGAPARRPPAGARRLDAIDLGGGVSSPPLAQHHERALRRRGASWIGRGIPVTTTSARDGPAATSAPAAADGLAASSQPTPASDERMRARRAPARAASES